MSIKSKTNIELVKCKSAKVENEAGDWLLAITKYEVLFNKYFYTYTPPRDLEEIHTQLSALENSTKSLLNEILQ